MIRKFLLDTGIASDLLERRHDVYERVRREQRRGALVGVCVPVYGELMAGAANSDRVEERKRKIRYGLRRLKMWPYDPRAAEEFGDIFARLRAMGRPIQQIDMQIAAIAKLLPDCTLVTKDSDYDAIDGLDTENWAVPPSNP